MLDSLRCANESRIPHIPVAAGLNILFALFYQPFHRFAGLSAWFFAQCLKDLFKSADMALSLFEMTPKAFFNCEELAASAIFGRASSNCVSAL